MLAHSKCLIMLAIFIVVIIIGMSESAHCLSWFLPPRFKGTLVYGLCLSHILPANSVSTFLSGYFLLWFGTLVPSSDLPKFSPSAKMLRTEGLNCMSCFVVHFIPTLTFRSFSISGTIGKIST